MRQRCNGVSWSGTAGSETPCRGTKQAFSIPAAKVGLAAYSVEKLGLEVMLRV